ncbi:MAG: Lrp/AsnC family transcriptional regulator [Hyphomicrobiaceae bacterium]|nr:Lrp/AsnC family transcriptional regulator [Hyphomicrobiaceae bacterium]
MHLDTSELALIDGWQRAFPLEPRPYAVIAHALGMLEADVISRLGRLRASGVLARIGATLRPNTAGASTLAAMRVPGDRLESVAAIVTAEDCVNHNYEREHEINLWFVIAGADRLTVDAVLARIRARTGLDILDLPLVRAFRLDLGFPIGVERNGVRTTGSRQPAPDRAVTGDERALLAELAGGLALEQRPYLALARKLGTTEDDVLATLGALVADGIVSRLGLIVRHRALGLTANAMTVFDVPETDIDRVGTRLAAEPAVTLCYQRPRRPGWPYNLFVMVHGRERAAVVGQIDDLAARSGAGHLPRAVLFSRRCFKQTGASLRAA